jgi:hypothetical protein
VGGVEDFITASRIGRRQEVDYFVRSFTTNDIICIQRVSPGPVNPGYSFAKLAGSTIRVTMQVSRQRLIGGNRLIARSQRRFVGRQFDDAIAPFDT